MKTKPSLDSMKNLFLSLCLRSLRFIWRPGFKPGLLIVVTITEHASDVAPKGILRLLIHRLQIFLVKYGYLRSLQLCEDQGICEKLKKRVRNHVLAILTTYVETRLNYLIIQKNFNLVTTCPKNCKGRIIIFLSGGYHFWDLQTIFLKE